MFDLALANDGLIDAPMLSVRCHWLNVGANVTISTGSQLTSRDWPRALLISALLPGAAVDSAFVILGRRPGGPTFPLCHFLCALGVHRQPVMRLNGLHYQASELWDLPRVDSVCVDPGTLYLLLQPAPIAEV